MASGNGIGKASTFSTIVDTPQGKRVWGYLEPGDYLFGADGKPTRIIATKRYEDIPFYRVSFDDGTYCDVSSGHLWNVKNRQDRRVGNNWRTLSTLDILNAGVLRKAGHKPNGEQHWAKQWEIPIQGEVEFPHRDVPIHPYFMGVWLGDGVVGQPRYSKPNVEIRERLSALGYKCCCKSVRCKR